MKKILVALVAFGLTAAAFAVTVTNRGEVITVTTLTDVEVATRKTNEVTLVSAPMRVLLSTDTDLTATDAQAYVSEGPGQLLISIAATGTTKIVYMSNGWGTNDWVLIK
jgi:hypothetical protein